MNVTWARMLGILLLVMILPLATLAGRADAQESRMVRLSFGSGWDALPAIVALERGFFAQEGLIVSGLAISSGEAVMGSLVSGSTDIALMPQRTFLIMAAAQFPVKAIAVGGWGTEMELVVNAGSTVKAVADLKGKKIGITPGSEAFPVLIRLLNQAKLRPTDVQIVQMSGEQLTQAFAQSLADAVFETRHFTTPLVQNGNAVVVVKPADVTKAIGSISGRPLVAGNKVIETEPDTVQRAVNAWITALHYIQQDPEDAARLLRIFFNRQGVTVTLEMAKAWVGYNRYDLYSWSNAAVADAEYNGWGLKAGQILKVEPKLAGYFENRFANAAVKKQGGS